MCVYGSPDNVPGGTWRIDECFMHVVSRDCEYLFGSFDFVPGCTWLSPYIVAEMLAW
jgi:hypothetical protein